MPIMRNIIIQSIRALSLVLACCALVSPAVPSAQTTDRVTSGVDDAMILLKRYDATHSLGDLKAAVGRIGGAATIDLFSFRTYVRQRRSFVRGFVAVLKAIELAYDPRYDPDALVNRPEIGCLEIATDTGLTPVCNPSQLKDANAKTSYAAAVAANKQKIAREKAYLNLVRVDQYAMPHLRSIFASCGDSLRPTWAKTMPPSMASYAGRI